MHDDRLRPLTAACFPLRRQRTQPTELPPGTSAGRVVRDKTPSRLALLLLVGLLSWPLGAFAERPQPVLLNAWHRAGQTFVVFQEVDTPAIDEPVGVSELRKLRQRLVRDGVRYRLYRSQRPIRSLDQCELVGEVPPLTCWNLDFYGLSPKPADKAFRYVVQDGQPPLAPGAGLFVHNPTKAGSAWYAVTVVRGEQENRRVTQQNTLQQPVRESVGPGEPVLQRVERPERFHYVRNAELHYFVRWEAPPNCAVGGRPFDYLVAFPPKRVQPAPVGLHLHCWGGNLNRGYGWWYRAEQGAVLIASNQIPYDWWTGYHERYWQGPPTAERWREGAVRPYTQRRLLSFLDWAVARWNLDSTRTFVAGNSMGGSGSPMLAIRHPDRIAWAVSWVGVHRPARSPRFRGSYERVYGRREWNVRFEDGTPVWDYFDDVWYLQHHPRAEVGLICFSNGKNDSGIGWQQAVDFFRVLQQTRRPHVFVWGQAGHGQRARFPGSLSDRYMPLDLRTNQSLPAFTHCSLDDDPGNGAPDDGDPQGQANLYLIWQTDDLVDQPDRWEVTVGLVDRSPAERCTVDVTPRRLQRFAPRPGERFRWSNTRLSDGQGLQSGWVTADRFGLVTLPQIVVERGRNRIRIWR